MEVRWSPRAKLDLLEIWSWHGREFPERGDRVVDLISAACDRLGRFPYLGPSAPRIAPQARKLSVRGYLVLYRLDPNNVVIVRVIDQRRLVENVDFQED